MPPAPYISVRQAAEREGCHISWISQMCREGRIRGAFKMGATWAIPDPFNIEPKAPWEKNHVTVEEAAAELGVTTKRVIQLCWSGRIVGARKIGKKWAIPTPIERIRGRPGRPPAAEHPDK